MGAAFIASSFTLSAQTTAIGSQAPSWVSTKGYWVVQSNKQSPKEAVVYFYNNDNILVYKKEVHDQKLNLKREKTLQQLKASLEDAVHAFENGMASNQPNQPAKNW